MLVALLLVDSEVATSARRRLLGLEEQPSNLRAVHPEVVRTAAAWRLYEDSLRFRSVVSGTFRQREAPLGQREQAWKHDTHCSRFRERERRIVSHQRRQT